MFVSNLVSVAYNRGSRACNFLATTNILLEIVNVLFNKYIILSLMTKTYVRIVCINS